MSAQTEEIIEADSDKVRLRMVSALLVDFVGPLSDKSHCHICLDSWYPTNTSNEDDDEFICKEPVRIDHPNCQCTNIIIGRSCITSWLLEKDTCPMCRQDIFELPPPHLRTRTHAHPTHDEEPAASDNEGLGIDSDYIEEEYIEEEFEGQSWLYANGNFLHSASLENGEHFDVNDIVILFLSKDSIEAFKTEEEKIEFYNTNNLMRSGRTHSAASWDMAYVELVKGRPQKLEDLFTVHGKVCIEGIDPDAP